MSLLLPVSLMFPHEILSICIQTFCNFSNLRKNHPPPPLALRPHSAAPLYVKFLRKVVYIHCLYLFFLPSSPPHHLLFLKKIISLWNSKHRPKQKGQYGNPYVLITHLKAMTKSRPILSQLRQLQSLFRFSPHYCEANFRLDIIHFYP